ncbi:MAG: HD-GYP domain-containing protein [Acidobacteria bacterium]|nr:MAG: HD-GYP domain-containing protein [Acidobacteriota bacterium]
MSETAPPRLLSRTRAYVILVVGLGIVAVGLSLSDLASQPADRGWFLLAGLTLVSGFLPVKLPSVSATISISETFVFAGTILFGPSLGTILVLLDAGVLSARVSFSKKRRLRTEQVLFNLAAPALSIWAAANIAKIHPLAAPQSVSPQFFVATLAAFTVLYFLSNSWLVTFAIALERNVPPVSIWWNNFKELLVNYFAGASIAALLVYNSKRIDPTFVGVILPLLLVLYLTYDWSTKRVEAERQKNSELNRVFLSTIEALAMAIDAKDQVTHGHIRRVQRYTMALATALGIRDDKQIKALEAAALLHDTGKLAVPEYILNKPGALTASEFERMKLHAAVGADILKSIDFPYPVEPIVRHHHENWDGTGYPDGLRGQDIPLGARILSVVDCYDALTSDRPYRPRMTRIQAEQILKDRRNKMYDAFIVDEFIKILDQLERLDAAEQGRPGVGTDATTARLKPAQLDVISSTTAEEREFNELSRELPRATSLAAAAEVLFRYLGRVIPAETFAFYVQKPDTNNLICTVVVGVGSRMIEPLVVPIGERISGWAFAHQQMIMNSDASLDLGPVARTLATPLRYALAAPIVQSAQSTAVVTLYGSQKFEKDHSRLVESAVNLFQTSIQHSQGEGNNRPAPEGIPRPKFH